MDKDLMTMPAASRLLGIHADTGYRLARIGQFPGGAALQIGHKWLVVPRLTRYLHGIDDDTSGKILP